MERLPIVVIATWLLCFSNAEFSLLRTVVDYPVGSEFNIFGRNGYCAHAYNYIDLVLFQCGSWPNAETYEFYSDGTLRLLNGKCLTAMGFTEGSTLEASTSPSPPTNATLWKTFGGDRQIVHQSSGLVLSAIGDTEGTRLTLGTKIYSAAQTWRLDKKEAVSSANIIGMDNYCLHYSLDNSVWLGLCMSIGTNQIWLMYPDATIRPYYNPSLCMSFNNLIDRRVLITTCGFSLTSERWVLTSAGNILNEHTNLVIDVPDANPNLMKLEVNGATGSASQLWRIRYNPNP